MHRDTAREAIFQGHAVNSSPSPLPTRSLSALATLFSAATDIPHALSIVAEEAGSIDRGLDAQLLLYDARRQVMCERISQVDGRTSRVTLAVALDHLPPQIQKRIAGGDSFADFGNQSPEYIKLLGIPAQEGAVLSLRGLHLDGELSGILAILDVPRRFGARLIDRIAPACDLFALAFARIMEHDARTEAVSALETLTQSIHSEYEKTIAALETRIADFYDAQTAPGGPEAARVAQLELAVDTASAQARTMGERLSAVEQQVEAAVGRLEKAHVELHRQSELVRAQSDILFRIEQVLDSSNGAGDPQKVVEEILAIVR